MIICISMVVTPPTGCITPMPMVGGPPVVGVNTMVTCPSGVTVPWMFSSDTEMTGPIFSVPVLRPVKLPPTEAPSAHSVWSPIGIGLAKLVLGAA